MTARVLTRDPSQATADSACPAAYSPVRLPAWWGKLEPRIAVNSSNFFTFPVTNVITFLVICKCKLVSPAPPQDKVTENVTPLVM